MTEPTQDAELEREKFALERQRKDTHTVGRFDVRSEVASRTLNPERVTTIMQGRVAVRKKQNVTTIKSRKIKIEAGDLTIVVDRAKSRSGRTTVRISSDGSVPVTVSGIEVVGD